MSPAITATRPSTRGDCVAYLLGQSHTEHDTSLPVVQRSSVTATPSPLRVPDPDIPGYLTEAVPSPAAI